MKTPRTPLEAVLGTRLDLDLDDLDAGNYELLDAQDAGREADLLAGALETGEFLYREAVRGSVARMGLGR